MSTNSLIPIVLSSFFAGFAVFVGGWLASVAERRLKKSIESYILHWTVAFGGGILVAAVAFVLVPKGIELFSVPWLITLFLAGALCFYFIDQWIAKKGGLLAQTMAMLMDFIPEALALGAVFAHHHQLVILLAFFIGFQNLPESFNAYFDLRKSQQPAGRILTIFFCLSFLGPLLAVTGNCFLADVPRLTGGIMLFSAGGILYLIFQDIAPASKINNHWEAALGANLGFMIGMVGAKIFG